MFSEVGITISKYNEEMKKSMADKLFFLHQLDIDVLVDYGCADGSLIGYIKELYPSITVIGYDISKQMIDIARSNHPDILFSDHWRAITHILEKNYFDKKTAVFCSSLLHEVYAYGTETSINEFWMNITRNDFDYIIIRDMMVSKTIDRPSDVLDVMKIKRAKLDTQLESFERKWGHISSVRNMIHFLLKYRYTENWNREVNENYLPLFFEELIDLIPEWYTINHLELYTLPYLKNKVREDFGIELKDNTHMKLILERKN